jgi:hypothetical protein
MEKTWRPSNDPGQSRRQSPMDSWYSERFPSRDALSGRHTRPGTRRRPAFGLVSLGVEPPAGIEPATPSLPLMRRWFTPPCSTSRSHTSSQVRGAAEGGVMGRGEATCGVVSGKSLASPGGWDRHVAPPGALRGRHARRGGLTGGYQDGIPDRRERFLCVIYEGWVSVKAWSAPAGWQTGMVAADQGGGRVDQSSIRAGSPMVSCGRGGSIKRAAVAEQGHDTARIGVGRLLGRSDPT